MQRKTILTSVLSAIILSLVGSTIFLLTSPPASFTLFFLFLILATAITVTTLGKTFLVKIKPKAGSSKLSLLLMLASVTLIILQVTKNDIEPINAVLYVTVFVFGLGFSVLRILRIKPNFSRIESLALAYPLSLASQAILGTVALILPSNSRGLVAAISIALLSIASLFVKEKEEQTEGQMHHALALNNNSLTLGIIIVIFGYFFVELYPQIAGLLELDIADNYLQALAFTKSTLPNSLYPLFGIYQSSVIYIVNPSIETFQVIAIVLNILAILSFYAMASQYLKRYGDHAPTIATLIWSAFAGFGWLTFLASKIESPGMSMLSIIGYADALSYGDITWRRLFFYLSMEATLTLVFAVFYFLKRNDLSRTKQIFLMTLLIAPIPLMHPYATYLLLPVLVCFAIICTKELRQQLRYTAYSLIAASFVSLSLNYILATKAPNISVNILTFAEYFLIGLAIVAITHLHGRTQNLNAITHEFSNTKLPLLVVTLLLLFYFASLLVWFSNSLTFNFGSLNIFGYVPWFLYPVKLGLMGVLTIAVAYILLASSKYRSRELIALFASALLMILVSRAISTVQTQYASEFTFNPNSWFSEIIRQNILSFREERMFELFKVPLAILASIVLGETIVTRTNLKNIRLSKYLIVSGLISLMLITGMASTILGFEYWHEISQTNQISPPELEIINNLRNTIYQNDKSIIISPKAPTYLDFTGATEIITESPAAWASTSPEFPLFVTRYSKTTPTYIYLHTDSDYQQISNTEEYLAHMTSGVQTDIENQQVQVRTVNNISVPVPQSSTTLVIPYDESTATISEPLYQEAYKQYQVLTLFFEKNVQFMNFYKEPINYNNVEINQTAIFNGTNTYIRINGTDTNFNKISVEFEYQPLDLTSNQVIISKLDWGTASRKSWEIAQYGRQIAFKISPDGSKEEVLLTGEILSPNTQYTVRSEYDGTSMRISIDNKMIASKSYQGGIFQSNTDLMIGAELYSGKPTAFARMTLGYVRVLNDIPAMSEPIFYAYDFLSSAGLNYTTTLSNDDTRNNYEIQILPYDDITTNEMLTELETNQQPVNTHYLVILNTNGYGPLLSLFGNVTSESLTANRIFTDKYSTTQFSAEVPTIIPNDNTEVRAQYMNDSFSSPLIMTRTLDQLTITYVNIYPLIQQSQLFNATLIQTLEEVLNDPIKTYDEKTISPWFYEPSLLFKGFEANGTIQVTSDAVASIKLQENSTVSTNSGTYYNASTLSTEGYETIQISGIEISLQQGCGFYATLIAYNPSITLQGNQTTTINITGQATFLLRQPQINVNGKIQFENFYMLHPPTIYTNGRNTTLSGNITLNIYVSDETTIALPYKLNSPITVKYEKPLMEFNETGSILLLAPYLIFAGILVAIVLLIKNFKEVDTEGNPKEKESQTV